MRRAFFALLILTLALAGVGCPCVKSAVNGSPELRWFLFANFGASKICPEMLKRGVPLKLPPMGNASVGRFFPAQCNVQVDDGRKAIMMTASGTGYVTLPVTRRVGFSIAMSVEYIPDFRLTDDEIYVWGRFNRFITQPDLRILGVENPVVNLATQTPFGSVAQIIGNGIVAGEIGRGFTVVRQDDGDDFALGHLEPPEKPKRQFKAGKGRVMLATDLTGIYGRSREYIGPLAIEDSGAALYFRSHVEGSPVLYAIVDRAVGDAWRRSYETAQAMGPPPGPVIAQGFQALGDASLAFPLPPGSYYVVVENQTIPPLGNLGMAIPIPEQPAYVSYIAEVGDKP